MNEERYILEGWVLYAAIWPSVRRKYNALRSEGCLARAFALGFRGHFVGRRIRIGAWCRREREL
jgi:hypothetical protein